MCTLLGRPHKNSTFLSPSRQNSVIGPLVKSDLGPKLLAKNGNVSQSNIFVENYSHVCRMGDHFENLSSNPSVQTKVVNILKNSVLLVDEEHNDNQVNKSPSSVPPISDDTELNNITTVSTDANILDIFEHTAGDDIAILNSLRAKNPNKPIIAQININVLEKKFEPL